MAEVDLMKMAEGGAGAASRSQQSNGRASNPVTDDVLAGLQRQGSSGNKERWTEMCKEPEPKPFAAPPLRKTKSSFTTEEKKDLARAPFVDPDLKESPRLLKDSPFLQSDHVATQNDHVAKVNKPVKPTSRLCKCFS